MTYAADCALLGLDDHVALHNPSVLKKQFYARARGLHPDIEGGDRDRFEAVREAYNRLHAEAVEHWETCPRCKGTGHVTLKGGFFSISTTCSDCSGTGKRQIDCIIT